MSISLNNIHEESASIRKQGLTPVIKLNLGIPTPSPQTLGKNLEGILKAVNPTLIILGDKETSAIPRDYSFETYEALLNECRAICNTYRISCTNGGLEDYAVIDYYLTTLDDDPVEYQRILETLNPKQRSHATRKESTSDSARIREYLKHYKTLPIDYVNITWSDYPIWIFGNIANFIKRKLNLDCISTEMLIPKKSRERDDVLNYVKKLRLPYVIWHFPFKDIQKSDLIDEDDNLTDIAQSLRRVNRSLI